MSYRTQTKKLHTYQRVKNTKNKLQSTFMMHKIGSHFVHFVDKMARSSNAKDHFKQFRISYHYYKSDGNLLVFVRHIENLYSIRTLSEGYRWKFLYSMADNVITTFGKRFDYV